MVGSHKDEATNFITRMERRGLTLSCVQSGGLASVFMKVKWMLEKVIHEDSTRYIVESLRAGMNKRKTASVYTPVLATPHVKSSGVIPNSGGKQ